MIPGGEEQQSRQTTPEAAHNPHLMELFRCSSMTKAFHMRCRFTKGASPLPRGPPAAATFPALSVRLVLSSMYPANRPPPPNAPPAVGAAAPLALKPRVLRRAAASTKKRSSPLSLPSSTCKGVQAQREPRMSLEGCLLEQTGLHQNNFSCC